MKISIAFLSYGVGLIGGPPETVDTLARALHEQGEDVTLICPGPGHETEYKMIPYMNQNWSNIKMPLAIPLFIKKVREISKECDIVHCFLPSPAFSFIGDIIHQKPTILDFDVPYIDDTDTFFPYLKEHPVKYVPRFLINNQYVTRLSKFSCEKYIVRSEFQKRQLEKLVGEENVKKIPNPLDRKKNRRHDREESRDFFGLKNETVGYIGHFTGFKGVEYLIRAFPDVLKEFPDAKLLLAWSGVSSKKRIDNEITKAGIGENVIFKNKVDVPKLMSALDVIVLPYLFNFGTNVFPHTLLEALSVGLPIVSSRIEIIEEILDDGKTGLLASPRDPESIAENIIKLLSSNTLRESISDNQRELAKNFNSEKIAKEYIKVYKEVQHEQNR